MTNKQALKNHWEKKLHIRYTEEFEIYKKMCGYKYNKMVIHSKYFEEEKILSYKEWKEMIEYLIKRLDKNEIEEYYRYLNSRLRYFDDKFSLLQSLFIPMAIVIIAFAIDIYKDLIEPLNCFICIIILMILVVLFIGYIIYWFNSKATEPILKHFYEDMKEIVDAYIKSLNQTTNP